MKLEKMTLEQPQKFAREYEFLKGQKGETIVTIIIKVRCYLKEILLRNEFASSFKGGAFVRGLFSIKSRTTSGFISNLDL